MAITLTEGAARQIKNQLSRRGKGVALRVGVKKVGCSGFAYTFDYADEIRESDRSFESHGATVVVADESLSFLDGSRLDFVKGRSQADVRVRESQRRQHLWLRRKLQPEGSDQGLDAMTPGRFGFWKMSERFP